jgi:hypothetical protein
VTEPHTWLELEIGVGDSRLKFNLALRLDGYTLLEIGDEDVQGVYDSLLDADQLTDLIDALTLVRDAAVETNNNG